MRTPFIFFLFLYCCTSVKAQLIPITLEQRIDNATSIFEGQVISQTSYWNDDKTHIYTSNIVTVYKVLKGTPSYSKVEVITKGGTVGDMMEVVSHSLALKVGDAGIFTAIPNTAKIITPNKLVKLKTYAGVQGFIKYDLEKGTAKDAFNTYKSVSKEVYPKVLQRSKTTLKTIQKAPFTIQ